MSQIFGILIVRPFGMILLAIYKAVGSYGLAVILFALLAKVLLFPLAYRNKKSMKKMSALSAKQQAIQKKYAKNREKMNEEIQKLYDKEGVNPMSGCLGSFIQLPIMMGLYYAVQRPLTYMMGLYQPDIELLAAKVGIDMTAGNPYTVQLLISEGLNRFVDATGHFTSEITNLSTGIATYLVPINFDFLGINLANTPSIKQFGVLWLIPILSGLTALLSSVIMQKMQGTESQVQGSMKTMLYMMPLMSVYFGFILPASIGIYWITNNIFTMVQEFILNKMMAGKDDAPVEPKKKNKKEEA